MPARTLLLATVLVAAAGAAQADPNWGAAAGTQNSQHTPLPSATSGWGQHAPTVSGQHPPAQPATGPMTSSPGWQSSLNAQAPKQSSFACVAIYSAQENNVAASYNGQSSGPQYVIQITAGPQGFVSGTNLVVTGPAPIGTQNITVSTILGVPVGANQPYQQIVNGSLPIPVESCQARLVGS